MVRLVVYTVFLFVSLVLLNGCAKVVNPYSSQFECPQAEKGKCVDISTAYEISLSQEKEREISKAQGFDNKTDNATSYLRGELLLSPAEKAYVEGLYNVLTKLLKDPQTPIIAPPKIVRILILPYQGADDKKFYSARYVYVIVDEPKWVLQNILTMPAAEESNSN